MGSIPKLFDTRSVNVGAVLNGTDAGFDTQPDGCQIVGVDGDRYVKLVGNAQGGLHLLRENRRIQLDVVAASADLLADRADHLVRARDAAEEVIGVRLAGTADR